MDSGGQIYLHIFNTNCNVGSGVLLKLDIRDKPNYSETPTALQQSQSLAFSLNVPAGSNTL